MFPTCRRSAAPALTIGAGCPLVEVKRGGALWGGGGWAWPRSWPEARVVTVVKLVKLVKLVTVNRGPPTPSTPRWGGCTWTSVSSCPTLAPNFKLDLKWHSWPIFVVRQFVFETSRQTHLASHFHFGLGWISNRFSAPFPYMWRKGDVQQYWNFSTK